MNRRGLGRGLSSLIPTTSAESEEAVASASVAAPPGLRLIPVADIASNPRQPRQVIAPEALAELAASIKEHGLIQPIVVTASRPGDPTPYIIIAGERRWRASRLAGLNDVPVVIKEASSQEMLELALVENVQRADLNPLEEAEAYQHLVKDLDSRRSRWRTAWARAAWLSPTPCACSAWPRASNRRWWTTRSAKATRAPCLD